MNRPALRWQDKAPDENLDYSGNWADELGADTIASSSWASSSPDLVIGTMSNTSTVATVWLSKGKPGITYELRNTIVTAGGRTLQQVFLLTIREPDGT